MIDITSAFLENIHHILKKQVSRCFSDDNTMDCEKFLKLISDSYYDSDRERKLMENAMSCMTKEVMETNATLIKQRDELLKSEERYRLATLATNDGLWELSLTNEDLYTSYRWLQIIGSRDLSEISTLKSWINLIHPSHRKLFKDQLQAVINKKIDKLDLEYKIKHKNGDYVWVSCRGILSLSKTGDPIAITGAQTDITESKTTEIKLREIAFHDPLTGLPNRLLFMDRLEQLIVRCKRDKNHMGALVFVDLNRFKFVNDTMGHEIGDMLLIKVSNLLSSMIRPSDTVSRLAGDEFTILFSEVTSAKEAMNIADRIMKELHGQYRFKGYKVDISSSMGLAVIDHKSESADAVLRNADLAMYDAKEKKLSKVKFFGTRHHKKIIKDLELEAEIKNAIREKQFYPVFQPIVEIETGKIKGFEVLARWMHPKIGIIMPNEFIPIAEKSGTILDIGTCIMEKSIEQLQNWINTKDLVTIPTVSINLSASQLVDDNHFSEIVRLLNKNKKLTKHIEFEITETIMLEDSDLAIRRITSLKNLGIMISIDDFGTGYSSLSSLNKYPIDTLKIDASFVQKMLLDRKSNRLISTMVAMAKDMGIKSIAEGVETPEQLKNLHEIGCDYAQGFYFSKPIDADVAEKLLETERAYEIKLAI